MPQLNLPTSTYGLWRVKTEGDEEGRTMQNLGDWEGHIDDIALHLANKVYYSLHFTPIAPRSTELKPTAKQVEVTLNISTGTWDLNSEERALLIKQWLAANNRQVTAINGRGYGSFAIVNDQIETEEERVARLKKQAMEKLKDTLTDDELAAIGLAG